MKPEPAAASLPQHTGSAAGSKEGTRRIRVLFLNTRDQCGADVAVHLQLMRAFDSERTSAYVLSNSQAEDSAQMAPIYASIPNIGYSFAPLGIPASRMSGRNKAAKLAAMAPVGRSLAHTLSLIRREKIDIIHATDRPRDAMFASLIGRLSGKPNVVHMHSNCGDHLSRATRWGFKNAAAAFAVSEFTRKGLVDLGLAQDRVHVVYNSTDTGYFDPALFAKSSVATRKELGISPDALVVGIVARLIPWKGQRELIDALALLLPDFPRLRLVIVGEGEDRETLRQRACEKDVAEQVVFTGWRDDVRPLLSTFDLFALPSYEEPFGLAITEAMAMRLPVIACASGGVPEIITHSENGWLVAPRSVPQLAQAIRNLLSDQELRRSLANNARRTVEERFSPRRQADLVSDLYARLVFGDTPMVTERRSR